MKTETLSQIRHNKEYAEKMETKRKGKIAIAIGIAAICAGMGLFYIATNREGSALVYLAVGIGTMLYSAIVHKPAE